MSTYSRPVGFSCCGCEACVAICPQACLEMLEDRDGFLHPFVVDDGCTNCDLCNRVCPVINPPPQPQALENPPVVAAYSNDEAIRTLSSSGGVFSVLAREVINRGGRVYGAAFDSDFALRHVGVDNLQDLQKLRGSKYVQSRIGTTYQDIRAQLRTNRQVLLTGTPCQVAGLYAFLGRGYVNLFTCDLVCHGVPSPKVFSHYLSYLRKKYGAAIESISFRDKRNGWNSFSVTVAFSNGKVYSRHFMQDVFMRGFLRNLYLQPACYECPFVGFPRRGDITLADYWGVGDKHPEFSDDKGTSLVFINTSKGKGFFDEIEDELTIAHSPREYAIAHNPSITSSYSRPAMRALFFRDLQRFPFEFIMYKYGLVPIPTGILRMYLVVKQIPSLLLRGVAFVVDRREAKREHES